MEHLGAVVVPSPIDPNSLEINFQIPEDTEESKEKNHETGCPNEWQPVQFDVFPVSYGGDCAGHDPCHAQAEDQPDGDGEELEFYHDSCGVRLADEAGIPQAELKEDPHLGQVMNSLGIRGAWRQNSAFFPS